MTKVLQPRGSTFTRRRVRRIESYRMNRVLLSSAFFIALMTLATLYVGSTRVAASDAIRHLSEANTTQGQFPNDLLLTRPYNESENQYFIVLHLIGIIYMFCGLAIVCDDYFVMALEEMVDRWEIVEDVAGATFMAAGGSAPELFTSIMGVFVSKDDVGFGTVVGSAVFNVLFVIGLCAVFAKQTLELTWWPLFRDCTFYSFSLLVLVAFIADGFVVWYEAIILFLLYCVYVLIMRNNLKCQLYVERLYRTLKNEPLPKEDERKPSRRPSLIVSPSNIQQATVDNAREMQCQRLMRVTRSAAMRTAIHAKVTRNLSKAIGEVTDFHALSPRHQFKVAMACVLQSQNPLDDRTVKGNVTSVMDQLKTMRLEQLEQTDDVVPSKVDAKVTPVLTAPAPVVQTAVEDDDDDDDDDDNPFAWPDTIQGQILFLITLPLIAILHLTIPNCSEPEKKRFFLITFGMSLVWIALFTYCMVWWASTVGEVLQIPSVVMGVTVLAAGTSIPDALSSIIVARRGFGDMAVSSSIGSNIFDILVGLPIPWMLQTCLVDPGSKIRIISETLIWSVTTLLTMVILVICSIIYTKWRLNRTLGNIMFVLYLGFVAQTLILEGGVF